MTLHPGEPALGPWTTALTTDVVRDLSARAAGPGPVVVAVDGRSAGGKTTAAGRLAAAVPHGHVVHTDDIAWWHSFFDWTDLLVTGVLEPLRVGRAVSYRPPPWDERDRPGAVEVPAGARLVVVEGVGAGRRELAPLVDAVVWVQSDDEDRAARERHRVAAGEVTEQLQLEWAAHEDPFLADQRTWERADLVVLGNPADDPGPDRLTVSAGRRGG